MFYSIYCDAPNGLIRIDDLDALEVIHREQMLAIPRDDHIGLGGDCCGEYLIVGRIADDGPPL